eukprot:6190587-Pleurochrysis_carterae.AAC.2
MEMDWIRHHNPDLVITDDNGAARGPPGEEGLQEDLLESTDPLGPGLARGNVEECGDARGVHEALACKLQTDGVG